MASTEFIRGIIPAVVTPMTDQEELDEKGLEALIDYLVGSGVHGIFTIGTAGEFWALTVEEKRRVFEWTVAFTRQRVPVYVGTCANTTREAVQLAEMAQRAGADALSVLTPTFIAPSAEQMFAHYRAIAAAVDLPIILYTNPDRTGNDLSVDLVVRLAEQVGNIAGIKDSSGNMTQTHEYIRRTPPGFRVLMGRDTLIYSALAHGAAGSIAASANIAPEFSVEIYEKYVAGDLEAALGAQRRLAPVRLAFALGTFPAMLKAGVELIGLRAGPPRAPVSRLSEAEVVKLRAALVQVGKLPA
ncbi:MAG: 4-hydroxy-tetrahydrodipicolinate synthase [Gemmatimonadota bacterium]